MDCRSLTGWPGHRRHRPATTVPSGWRASTAGAQGRIRSGQDAGTHGAAPGASEAEAGDHNGAGRRVGRVDCCDPATGRLEAPRPRRIRAFDNARADRPDARAAHRANGQDGSASRGHQDVLCNAVRRAEEDVRPGNRSVPAPGRSPPSRHRLSGTTATAKRKKPASSDVGFFIWSREGPGNIPLLRRAALEDGRITGR